MIISVNNTIINHTCQDRSPYVYEICHKPSGKLYIGVRFAKNCHHTELLEPKGYYTSSDIIQKIIKKEGLDSFEITYIEEFDNTDCACKKEVELQRLVEAHKNECYYNQASGSSFSMTEETWSKISDTNQIKYGNKWFFGSETHTNHIKDNPTKYNYNKKEHQSKAGKVGGRVVYDNKSATEKTEWHSKGGKKFQEKIKTDECFKKEIFEKKAKNCLKKYGVDNYHRTEIGKFLMKARALNREKYNCPLCKNNKQYDPGNLFQHLKKVCLYKNTNLTTREFEILKGLSDKNVSDLD